MILTTVRGYGRLPKCIPHFFLFAAKGDVEFTKISILINSNLGYLAIRGHGYFGI